MVPMKIFYLEGGGPLYRKKLMYRKSAPRGAITDQKGYLRVEVSGHES